VADAYLGAGKLDDAILLARSADDAHRPLLLQHAVRKLLAEGKLEEARRLALTLPPSQQAQCLCLVATEQVKNKKTDGLADWIDAVPTAEVRADVNLAVALAVSGKRNHDFEGATRVPRAR
jgi:hypothetical protein